MRFGEAIDRVTKYPGALMRRASWSDRVIGFKLPDGRSDMNGAYFYARYDDVEVTVPWLPDAFDMTAHDWEVYEQ